MTDPVEMICCLAHIAEWAASCAAIRRGLADLQQFIQVDPW